MGPGLRRDDVDMRSHSRDAMRPSFARNSLPSKTEGAGKTGCALHPRSRVRFALSRLHTSIQGSGEHPAFPAQGKIKNRMEFYGPLWNLQAIDQPCNIPITCHMPS